MKNCWTVISGIVLIWDLSENTFLDLTIKSGLHKITKSGWYMFFCKCWHFVRCRRYLVSIITDNYWMIYIGILAWPKWMSFEYSGQLGVDFCSIEHHFRKKVLQKLKFSKNVNFIHCEKEPKFQKISNLFLKLLVNVKTNWEIWKKIVGFSELLKFNSKKVLLNL